MEFPQPTFERPAHPAQEIAPRQEKVPGMLASFGSRVRDVTMRTLGLQQREPAFAGGPTLGRLEGVWNQAATLRADHSQARGQTAERIWSKVRGAWDGAKQAFGDLGLKEEIYDLFPRLEPADVRTARERARYDRLITTQLSLSTETHPMFAGDVLHGRAERAALTLARQFEMRGGVHTPERQARLSDLAGKYLHRGDSFDQDTKDHYHMQNEDFSLGKEGAHEQI